MPRHPKGDQAMTGAERQRLWRERLRKERGPVLTDRERLAEALAENERLRKASGAPAELAEAQAENDLLRDRIRELEQAAPAEVRGEIALLRQQVRVLKAQIAAGPKAAKAAKTAKPVRPQLDPASEAALQIERLKAKNQSLQAQVNKLRRQYPFEMRSKIAKALTEMTTSPEARLSALQAWNGLARNRM